MRKIRAVVDLGYVMCAQVYWRFKTATEECSCSLQCSLNLRSPRVFSKIRKPLHEVTLPGQGQKYQEIRPRYRILEEIGNEGTKVSECPQLKYSHLFI